jgi:tetratricopeptide (TPR) repeat protein
VQYSFIELVEITLTLDQWLLSALPSCFKVKSPHGERPESLSALLSCLLINHYINTNAEYNSFIAELRAAAIDLLQWRGKRSHLRAWLDVLFSRKDNFSWTTHIITQGRVSGYQFSVDEILSLFSHDEILCSELKNISLVDAAFESLRICDYLKRPEEKNYHAIFCEMENIADIFSTRLSPESNRHWREHAMTAMMFYTSVLTSLNNLQRNIALAESLLIKQRVQQKFKLVESCMLVGIGAIRQNAHSWEASAHYAEELGAYRAEVKAEFQAMVSEKASTDDQLIERANRLQHYCNNYIAFIKNFMNTLINSSVADLGPAPCAYAFIGFGSLANYSVSPYSDIEFGILVESDIEENIEYFRNLSYVLHAKIIQLGETPIPTSLFDYSFDHLTNVGFCFDLGGKISLGRYYQENEIPDPGKAYGSLKYSLIATPEKLMRYIEDDFFAIDRSLPVELCHCTHIAGEISITSKYQLLLAKRMLSTNNKGQQFCQRRAIDLLNGKQGFIMGDLQQFKLKLDGTKDGMLYDVKRELYRFADRLVNNLALFFGITVGSAADKINHLCAQGFISEDAVRSLKIIDGIAKEIRVKTYFFYGRQHERLSVLPVLFNDEKSIYKVDNLQQIVRFYELAYPLEKQIKQFAKHWESKPEFAKQLLTKRVERDDDLTIQIGISRRLGLHSRLQSDLSKILQERPQIRSPELLAELANSYYESGAYQQALETIQDQLHFEELDITIDPLKLAITLENLSGVYGALAQREEQVSHLNRALAIYKQIYGEHHLVTAACLIKLGSAYGYNGDLPRRMELQEQALFILESTAGADSLEVAMALDELASCYRFLNPPKAVMLRERALRIEQHVYGVHHLAVASSLGSLALLYGDQGLHDRAIPLLELAVSITEKAYGPDHIMVANFLTNLGLSNGEIGAYLKQVNLLERALTITEHTYGPEHVQVADILLHLGAAYGSIGDHQRQIEVTKHAVAIDEVAYGCNYDSIPTLHYLSLAYSQAEEFLNLVLTQEKILSLEEQEYGPDSMELLSTLDILLSTYGELGDFAKQDELRKRISSLQNSQEEQARLSSEERDEVYNNTTDVAADNPLSPGTQLKASGFFKENRVTDETQQITWEASNEKPLNTQNELL